MVVGEYEINCYQPYSETVKQGVIYPVSTEIEMKEIEDLMIIFEGSSNSNLVKAGRMKKRQANAEWVDSLSVKLVFNSAELPSRVSLESQIYRVRPFIQQPLQCYKCQRIGHTASSCKSKDRCMLCG